MSPSTAPTSGDLAAIRTVVHQVYQAISGPAGPRDWKLLARMFAPEGRMLVAHKQSDGTVTLQSLSVSDYRRTREPYFQSNPFYEEETHAEVQVIGNLAHVLSYYESRRAPGEPPFETGVNSIQLARTGAGWRVVFTMWEAGLIAASLGS